MLWTLWVWTVGCGFGRPTPPTKMATGIGTTGDTGTGDSGPTGDTGTGDTGTTGDTGGLPPWVDPECGTVLGQQTGWAVRAGQQFFLHNHRSCYPALHSMDEAFYWFQAPVTGVWHFRTNAFCAVNPEMSLYEPACDGAELVEVLDSPGILGNARIEHHVEAGEWVRLGLRATPGLPLSPIGLVISLGVEEDCGDGIDEDLDLLTDCHDLDCYGSPECPVDTGL